jgi:hypothetical protein
VFSFPEKPRRAKRRRFLLKQHTSRRHFNLGGIVASKSFSGFDVASRIIANNGPSLRLSRR